MKKIKKNIIVLSILTLFSGNVNGDPWIILALPRAAMLGVPVIFDKKGQISTNFNLKYNKTPEIETKESVEGIQEYENEFKNFITQYFNKSKVSIRSISASNLKIKSLTQEAIDKLQIGPKYVYEGITADEVTITLSSKKEFSSDISKALKDISSAVTSPEATQVVEKIMPFLDSISYTSGDSIYYKVTIKNPNVYYKVTVIQLTKKGNPCNCNWEKKCFLYFTDMIGNDFPRSIKLENDFTEQRNKTISRFPEFCGKDRMDVQYCLKVEKLNDGLHLWIYGSDATVKNNQVKKIEVPFIDDLEEGNKITRKWRLNRTFLYRFEKNGIIKNVYIEVSAIQLDGNSLDLINWGTDSYGENALTCLKYPEFTGKYVKK